MCPFHRVRFAGASHPPGGCGQPCTSAVPDNTARHERTARRERIAAPDHSTALRPQYCDPYPLIAGPDPLAVAPDPHRGAGHEPAPGIRAEVRIR